MLEGDFAYSFILGVLAAVNPCGFVLLPTYLVYFLGTEMNRGAENPAIAVGRALKVGAAVSSGFVGIFLVVGTISRLFTTVIRDNAKYAALVIGVALVAAGIAMFRGWKPPVAQPSVQMSEGRTVRSMFVFGIVYAVASIGCTLPFLTSVIFSSIGRDGFVSGILSTVLYGLGMGMLVTGLTVALAFARVGVVSVLKRGFPIFDKVSAGLVVLTGIYLTWYWWAAISESGSSSVVRRVERWQSRVADQLQQTGAVALAVVLGAVIAVGLAVARRSRGTVRS
ncbi:MAG: cytochrome c biogenesis CcdA family protein [Ilumatobacteraceae bacterium]